MQCGGYKEPLVQPREAGLEAERKTGDLHPRLEPQEVPARPASP